MKLHYFMFFLFATVSSVICSCSNDDFANESRPPLTEKDYRLSAEQAQKNALDFITNLNGVTRSQKLDLKVASVKAISANKSQTRSYEDSINLDTLFYVVCFEDNNGFVIASSDEREIPVFAYVKDGCYEEADNIPEGSQETQQQENNGYLSFMCNLQELEIRNRTQYHKDPNNDDILIYDGIIIGGDIPPVDIENTFEVHEPLLSTKWGQWEYNDYCNGYPTGCVMTAVSQICSYLQKPNHIEWSYNGIGNQCNLDWGRINNECRNHNGKVISSDLHNQVANLMRFWGVAFDADYSSDGTGADSEEAMEKLSDFGFNVSSLNEFNSTDVINELRKGDRIIYMSGSERYYHEFFVIRHYVGGHAWVVDGFIHTNYRGLKADYLHCNWGWQGDKNGYYLAGVFDSDAGPIYDDNTHTRGGNYEYLLKYSTICK